MIRLVLGLLATSLISSSTLADARAPYRYGPTPDWARYKVLGEAAVRAQLSDPDRWSISWPHGYLPTGWMPTRKDGVPGYFTCGVLEDRAMRQTLKPFAVVIDYDQVKSAQIAGHNIVGPVCKALIHLSKFPPASAMDQSNEVSITTLGLSIHPMPEGAYVTAVTTAGPAVRAGIVEGTVISRANGITLAGMGNAMASVLEASTPLMVVQTVAGRTLTIGVAQQR